MTYMLFCILAVITIISILSLYVFLCLFVYADASVNSDKPIRWLLITLLTPNMFGFLIYILVGRNKDRKSVRRFKLPAVVSAFVAVISTTVFLGSVLFSNDIPVINNVSIGMVNNNIGSQWTVEYKSSGETLERTISLTDNELKNFSVEASCDDGELYLLMIQGKNAKVIDLKNYSKEELQLDGFDAGKVKLSLYNESAKNAKIKIDW